MTLDEFLTQNQKAFLDNLLALLRIPSVSAKREHKADVARCAEHLAAHLKRIGMQKSEVLPTAGHPVVYAEWLGAPGKPTVLVYGHYDVQPPEPLELWKTPPFEPVVREDRVIARGACDDKGQVSMHLSAIEAHLATSKALPLNVKLIIEGEEEIGSEHLDAFLATNAAKLAADVIVVSDTSMLGPGLPALTYSLRGLVYTEVEVVGPTRDLHSGEFGGAVMNPANALAGIIAQLKDADGRITVPGFYDRVRALGDAERQALAALPFDEPGFIRESGAPEAFGEKGFSTLERISARPTLDVNGIWGGYQGEGSKTVLPSMATAKISMRLVADQDPGAIYESFKAHVQRLAPPQVTVTVRELHGAVPFLTDPSHPMLQAAVRALQRAWGKAPSLIREGGSIPVMASFQKALRDAKGQALPCILMGFGLHDDMVHAPNEKFSLESFHGGTRSCAYLYEELARGA